MRNRSNQQKCYVSLIATLRPSEGISASFYGPEVRYRRRIGGTDSGTLCTCSIRRVTDRWNTSKRVDAAAIESVIRACNVDLRRTLSMFHGQCDDDESCRYPGCEMHDLERIMLATNFRCEDDHKLQDYQFLLVFLETRSGEFTVRNKEGGYRGVAVPQPTCVVTW